MRSASGSRACPGKGFLAGAGGTIQGKAREGDGSPTSQLLRSELLGLCGRAGLGRAAGGVGRWSFSRSRRR